MNILIIGSGGREHAIAWKVSQSEMVKNIYAIPGNPGIGKEKKVKNFEIENPSIQDYIRFAKSKNIDLTIVGPEAPLVDGIVDEFKKNNLKIFGPCKAASQLEGSKSFCKDILNSGKVLTAKHETFTDSISASKYIKKQNMPIVIKADGLAAGKGVFIVEEEEMLLNLSMIYSGNADGISSSVIVIEEFLKGEEASFICLVSGDSIVPLASSKRPQKIK